MPLQLPQRHVLRATDPSLLSAWCSSAALLLLWPLALLPTPLPRELRQRDLRRRDACLWCRRLASLRLRLLLLLLLRRGAAAVPPHRQPLLQRQLAQRQRLPCRRLWLPCRSLRGTPAPMLVVRCRHGRRRHHLGLAPLGQPGEAWRRRCGLRRCWRRPCSSKGCCLACLSRCHHHRRTLRVGGEIHNSSCWAAGLLLVLCLLRLLRLPHLRLLRQRLHGSGAGRGRWLCLPGPLAPLLLRRRWGWGLGLLRQGRLQGQR